MWFKKLLPSPILLWYELQTWHTENLKCCNCVTQSEKDSKGAGVMWGKPSAILSTLLASPFLCHLHLPPSASIVRILILSQSSSRRSQATNDTFVHPTSLLLLPPWLSLSFLLFIQTRCVFLDLFFSILLTASLFSFPVISSLCYSSHFCSLDQYSVPSSCHQALHHLTHLYPLAGLDVPSSPSVLCIHLGAAKCWIESVNVGPGV